MWVRVAQEGALVVGKWCWWFVIQSQWRLLGGKCVQVQILDLSTPWALIINVSSWERCVQVRMDLNARSPCEEARGFTGSLTGEGLTGVGCCRYFYFYFANKAKPVLQLDVPSRTHCPDFSLPCSSLTVR